MGFKNILFPRKRVYDEEYDYNLNFTHCKYTILRGAKKSFFSSTEIQLCYRIPKKQTNLDTNIEVFSQMGHAICTRDMDEEILQKSAKF